MLRAREIQTRRFEQENAGITDPERKIFCNSAMSNRQIEKYCPLSEDCKELLERIIERFGLSARACSRIIRIARTIADMEGAPDITAEHIAEAASYRMLDRTSLEW